MVQSSPSGLWHVFVNGRLVGVYERICDAAAALAGRS